MSTLSKTLNTFVLSIIIMILIVTVILGFMLGPFNPLPWVIIFLLAIIPFLHNKLAAKNKIVWDDSLSTGIEFIDQDHKKLISLINKFQQATEYQVSQDKVLATMDKVIDYTKYHFSREEELLKMNDYPELDEHQKQHNKMIDLVTQYADECREGKTLAVDHMHSFLQSWLIDHINHTDQKYVPYMKVTSLPKKSLLASEGEPNV